MKKIVFSLIIVFGIVLLTGCGKVDFSKVSHIECVKTESNSSDTTQTTMIFSYDKNEKINDFKVSSDVTYKTTMSPEAIKVTEKAMKLIGSIPGISFESQVRDNGLYYGFTGNIKMLKILMKQLNKNYDDSKVIGDTKTEALSELTKEGYTCKDYKK